MDYQLLTGVILIFATLAVLGFSGFVLYSHKVTAYNGVRKILIAICFLIGLRASLETLKFGSFAALAPYYIASTGITDALILISATAMALGIYLDCSDADLRELFSNIRSHRRHMVIIGAGIVYLAILLGLLLTKPYSIENLHSLSGGSILSVHYSKTYQFLRIPFIALLVGYAAPLIYQAARRTKDKELQRSLKTVWISLTSVGLLIVVSNVYLSIGKTDLNGVTYLIMSAVFSLTAIGFNRASVFAGFLEYKPDNLVGTSAATFPFSKRLKKDPGYLSGKEFLLESKGQSEFEPLVRDFCIEQLSTGEKVFVVTNIASPIYRVLSKYTNIRFCLFSEKVSHPVPRDKENEIAIPQDGIGTILHVIETGSSPKEKITLVIDNLTDMFVTLGREAGQKFLKSANEYIAANEATALFLVYPDALDPQVANWVRSLFGNILSTSPAGMRPLKEQI
jgi:hypothetical protein